MARLGLLLRSLAQCCRYPFYGTLLITSAWRRLRSYAKKVRTVRMEDPVTTEINFCPQILWLLYDFRNLIDRDNWNHPSCQYQLFPGPTEKSSVSSFKYRSFFRHYSVVRDPSLKATKKPCSTYLLGSR